MATETVNKDGSVTFSTDEEAAGPTGAYVHEDGAVTHYFDGIVPEDVRKKAVQSSENKSAAGKAKSK